MQSNVLNRTINWSRCIHIDREIDGNLVNALIPQIMALRQESDEAITLALNSPGGAVGLPPTIRALIRDPNQDGEMCELVTVATRSAYSAAAMMLAMGDYAVALPHAEVLFHDVRYGSVSDVTPTSALRAAKSLQAGNDRASLEIADFMFDRWMWMCLDGATKGDGPREEAPAQTSRFEEIIANLNLPKCEYVQFDLVGLMLFMHKHLRVQNECVLENALDRLARWGAITTFAARPHYRPVGGRKPGMLDGLAQLYREVHPRQEVLGGKENEQDLAIFMAVLAIALNDRGAAEAVDIATRDMNLFRSINSPRHWRTAMRLMLDHKYAFFDIAIVREWDSLDDGVRSRIAEESSPLVRLIWLLCVQVARELFSDEHRLTPIEALVLGLVDEVPGVSIFESRRAYSKKAAASAAKGSSAL